MRLDFPALGYPTSPTSAMVFNMKSNVPSSPGVPGVVCLGAWFVEDLKCSLPFPPIPPFKRTIDCQFDTTSVTKFPVSENKTTVPIGTFNVQCFPFLPCIWLPIPGLPFSAFACGLNLYSDRSFTFSSPTITTFPPSPPSPPFGPPFGRNFAL